MELEDKFDALEDYSNTKIDEGRLRAYNTLQAVRDGCDRVGEGVIGEGRRRAAVLVEVLEASYSEILQGRETIAAKVHHGIEFLTGLLADFENRVDASIERKIDRAKRGFDSAVDAKDKLAESIERAIKAAREKRLITYEELPWPWRVNPYILNGYRFTETPLECIRSAFAINNETCNIWSHGIGFFIICAIAFYYYHPTSASFYNHTTADKVINGIFFVAAAKALACSTIWHTFSSISHQHTMERFACVDYSGISLLIAASIMTTEYTAFYVDPVSRWIYMSITAVLGIAGAILPWQPKFNRADMRVWRVAFYVTLGATGGIPMFQLCYTRGAAWTLSFYLPILKSVSPPAFCLPLSHTATRFLTNDSFPLLYRSSHTSLAPVSTQHKYLRNTTPGVLTGSEEAITSGTHVCSAEYYSIGMRCMSYFIPRLRRRQRRRCSSVRNSYTTKIYKDTCSSIRSNPPAVRFSWCIHRSDSLIDR